jgi:plastocyanin
MRAMLLFSVTSLLAIGCGDDGGKTADTIDASIDADTSQPDAKPGAPDANVDAMVPSNVKEVACPTKPAMEVTAVDAPTRKYQFDGADSGKMINPNDIVKFTMPSSHNAVSGKPGTGADGKFKVNYKETKCLQFTEVGTFPFYCEPHQFTGEIKVIIN